jgi:hypothetical protein
MMDIDDAYMYKLHSIKNTPNLILIKAYKDIFSSIDIKLYFILRFWNLLEYLKIPLKIYIVSHYKKRQEFFEYVKNVRDVNLKKRLEYLKKVKDERSKRIYYSNLR